MEIFTGKDQHTVNEGINQLTLRMAPILDERELSVPRITRITRPFQMEKLSRDNITVVVDTVKKQALRPRMMSFVFVSGLSIT